MATDACRELLNHVAVNVINAMFTYGQASQSVCVAVAVLLPRADALPAAVQAVSGSGAAGDAWIAAQLDPATVLVPYVEAVVRQVSQRRGATATLETRDAGVLYIRMCWVEKEAAAAPAATAVVQSVIPDPVIMARELAARTDAHTDDAELRAAVLDLALGEIGRGITAAHKRGRTSMIYDTVMLHYHYSSLGEAHQRALLAAAVQDGDAAGDDRCCLQRRIDALIAVDKPATHIVPHFQQRLAMKSPYYTVTVATRNQICIAWRLPGDT